jgi:hypothetical protein
MSKKSKKTKEILDYDTNDTSTMIDKKNQLRFEDVGLKLPSAPPTQVISIRLPTELLNELRAMGSQDDVPYQSLIKIMLADGIREKKKKSKKTA